jgi:hypothetical protein
MPIFAVHDVDVAMAYYQRLGFAVRAYSGGGHGFASREGIEIHLGVMPVDDRRTSSAYLFVDDAENLALRWRRGSLTAGHRMGQHEGAVVARAMLRVIQLGTCQWRRPLAKASGTCGTCFFALQEPVPGSR